jgi:PAS domain S-box-containing protein
MGLIKNWVEKRVKKSHKNKQIEESLKVVDETASTISELTRELRKKEEELIAEKEKYLSMYNMLQSIIDGMPGIIWAKDLDGRFILTNKEIRRILMNDCSVEESLGRTAEEFAIKINNNDTLHVDCERTDKIVLATLEAGNFIERGLINGKQSVYKTTKGPLYDNEGNLIGTVGFGRDITEECKNAFYVLSNVEEAAKTCPRLCVFSDEMNETLGNVIGTLHKIISTTCDLNKKEL